jgi:quinoprotein relay system zinc metallohydrolase 2
MYGLQPLTGQGHRWLIALLRGLLVCIVLAFGCPQAQSAPGRPGALPVRELASGIFVHIGALEDWAPANGGDVANLAFIVGSRCVAVVDTGGTPVVGHAWLQAIQHVTQLPVCYVINTHAHPDHVLGNAAFADLLPSPQFVVSARFSATLAAREPYYRLALERDFGRRLPAGAITYPTVEVAQSLDLDLGGRLIRLQAWPTAHTDNDLTVIDLRTRTLLAADLLFVQHLPALDGSLRGWLCVLEGLRKLDVTTVVPGHGPVRQDLPAVLDAERDYLQSLLHDTRAALARGLSLQQAVDRIGVAPEAHWLLAERFQRRNVTTAYAELEWEEPGKEGDAACQH